MAKSHTNISACFCVWVRSYAFVCVRVPACANPSMYACVPFQSISIELSVLFHENSVVEVQACLCTSSCLLLPRSSYPCSMSKHVQMSLNVTLNKSIKNELEPFAKVS